MQTHLHAANGIDLLVIVAWEFHRSIRNDLSYICRPFSGVEMERVTERQRERSYDHRNVNYKVTAFCHCWSHKKLSKAPSNEQASNLFRPTFQAQARWQFSMFSHRTSHLPSKAQKKLKIVITSELKLFRELLCWQKKLPELFLFSTT